MRKTIKLIILSVILLSSIIITKSFNYYNIKEAGIKTYTYKTQGNYLDPIDAYKQARNYNSKKRYFYKYEISNTYTAGFFPFINTKIDTISSSLWEASNTNSNN